MLKLSKFKLSEGYSYYDHSKITLIKTEKLTLKNKDKVCLDLFGWDWHEDAMKFFAGSYELLLDYFDGDASKFCVVRNYEFCNYIYVIHV